MSKKMKIITRKSLLALWQTNLIKIKLKEINKKKEIEIKGITTYGDQNTKMPLYDIGGKGLFIKELEQILIEQKADIAVHSMKDVPYLLPKNLNIVTVIKRTDSRDAFISKNHKNLNKIPFNSIIATTSLRRKLQILYKKPDLNIIPIRGNIDSRINKLINKKFDAILLSSAGIIRLKLYKYFKTYININDITPAIGQGVIGIEKRKSYNDKSIPKILCKKTYKCIYTERYINKILYSNCQSPIGTITSIKSNYIFLNAITISNNGKIIIRNCNNTIIKLYKNLGIITSQNLIIKGYKIMNIQTKKKIF